MRQNAFGDGGLAAAAAVACRACLEESEETGKGLRTLANHRGPSLQKLLQESPSEDEDPCRLTPDCCSLLREVLAGWDIGSVLAGRGWRGIESFGIRCLKQGLFGSKTAAG